MGSEFAFVCKGAGFTTDSEPRPAPRRLQTLVVRGGTYAFSRSLDGDTFVIGLNTSDSTQEAQVTYETQTAPQVLFGEASEVQVSDGHLRFKIPPRSGVMFK